MRARRIARRRDGLRRAGARRRRRRRSSASPPPPRSRPRGRFAGAAAALERLGHERPADSFAARRALRSGRRRRGAAGQSGARAPALRRGRRRKYPSSRLARRARTRADFLARSLTTGEAPLREYDAILAGADDARRAPSRARAWSALLQKWPDFALADRALYLARPAARPRSVAGTRRRARFAEIERRFPSSEWALRGKKARADILLSRGHPFVARALYRELIASSDPVARSAGARRPGRLGELDRAQHRCRRQRRSTSLAFAFAAAARRARRARACAGLPFELLYYLPVGAALRRRGADRESRHRRGHDRHRRRWRRHRLGHVARLRDARSSAARCRSPRAPARTAAVASPSVALVFLAVQATGLTDIVVETLRSGPERG